MPSRNRVPGIGMELSSSQPTRRRRSSRRWSRVPTSGTSAGEVWDRFMAGSYTGNVGAGYGAARGGAGRRERCRKTGLGETKLTLRNGERVAKFTRFRRLSLRFSENHAPADLG